MKQRVSGGILTWSDLADSIERRIAGEKQSTASNLSHSYKHDYNLTRTIHEALELMRFGWRAGAEALKDADALNAGAENGNGWALDVVGQFPLMPAYLSGDPDNMWTREYLEEPRKRLRLVYPAGYRWSVKSHVAAEYGKALAALTRSLEAAGVSVELFAIDAADGDKGHRLCTGVVVREFGAPLDLDRVAFSGHPDFTRRMIFGHRERVPMPSEDLHAEWGGYGGYSIPPSIEDVRCLLGDDADASVILPCHYTLSSLHTTERMLEAMRGAVEKFSSAPMQLAA